MINKNGASKLVNKTSIIKKAVYFLLIVLFALYLIFVNGFIISWIDGDFALYSFNQSKNELPEYNDEIISRVRRRTTNIQLMRISLYGYAFFEGEKQPDFGREVKLLIIGENGREFATDAAIYSKSDYTKALTADGYTMPGEVAFTSEFSVLQLRDGVYQVYLYVKESPTIYGVQHSGVSFEINGKDITWL